MFVLVESARALDVRGGWAGRAGSFALHAMMLTAAVLLTRQPAAPAPAIRIATPLVWGDEPTPVRAAPAPPGVAPRARPVFQLPTLPPTPLPNVVPSVLPAPAPGAVPGPAAPSPGAAAPAAPGPGTWAPPADVRTVDELPVLAAHPPIHYPDLLRQAGIEGRVVLEAVLDTLGRVEPGSVRIVRGNHPLFEREAAAVVAASRYRPARLGGRAVRVRIEVPVEFTIRR